MTPAAHRHMELERQLVVGRALGTLSDAEEDAVLEEMGDLWWQMTDPECDEANRRAAAHARGGAAGGLFVPCHDVAADDDASTGTSSPSTSVSLCFLFVSGGRRRAAQSAMPSSLQTSIHAVRLVVSQVPRRDVP